MILDEVAPLLHKKPGAPAAVSVADAPAHIADDDALTVTFGAALTTTVTLELAEQPLAPVPVTEYVVVTAGLTTILAEVAPVFQRKLAPPETVNVADAPAQIDVADAAIFTLGIALTVIVFEMLAEQPLAFVPVTEYVDVADGLTVIEDDVAPLLQT